jgi:hypothetical protein
LQYETAAHERRHLVHLSSDYLKDADARGTLAISSTGIKTLRAEERTNPMTTSLRKTVQARRPTVVRHRHLLGRAREEELRTIPDLVAAIEGDYQFRLAYLVLTSIIQATPAVVAVREVDAVAGADQRRAERLAANLTSVWQEALPHALRAIAYGRAAFERTYRHDAREELFLVDGLDFLPFEHTRLVLDDVGSFAGIELEVGEEKILLEPPRAWWFALDPTTTQPHGRSRYLGAPWDVFRQRRQLAEQESIWFAKFALGHGVARAPEKEDLDPACDLGDLGEIDERGEPIDPMEVMREQCALIESGGVLVLSSKTYGDGKFLYDYIPTPGPGDGSALENRRRMLDAAALRSLGVPERALTQDSDRGSYALAEVHRQVLEQTCEGILAQLANAFGKHVVQKAIGVNRWAGSPPVLTLLRQPIGGENRHYARELARILLAEGDGPAGPAAAMLDLPKLLELANLPTIGPISK